MKDTKITTEQHEKRTNNWKVTIAIIVVMYIIGVVIDLSFNPALWEGVTRGFVVVFGALCVLINWTTE